MILKSTQTITLLVALTILFGLLVYFDFNVDSKEMLGVFVPLVWGIFVALGGCLIKLNQQEGLPESDKKLFKKVQGLCFILVLKMMTFLGLAGVFPARNFLKSKISFVSSNWGTFSIVFDSLSFSIFVVSGLGAVLVSAYILIKELEN